MPETYISTNKHGIETIYTVITTAEDVTEEVLDAAQEIEEGWFGDDERIDWQEFFDRKMEGYPLNDGTKISLGEEYDTPAMRKIQKHIRYLRRYGG